MFVWIIIIIFVVLYLFGRNNSSNTTSRNNNPPRTSTGRRPTRRAAPISVQIKTLYDPADTSVASTPQQKKLISDVNTYQREKRKTLRPIQSSGGMESISFDLTWSEDLSELMQATEVLYTNAQMNCNRRLESARFQYYINLHFRSFTAADLCYAKKEEMLPCYESVNTILRRLNDRSDPLRVSKEDYSQIVRIKDSMKSIISFLSERVSALNHQTQILRDKIRDECGTGGRRWYESLMERRTS